MTAKVRIEYVRPRLGGDLGLNNDVIFQIVRDAASVVVPAEILLVGAASVQSAPAPVFAEDGRGMLGGVYGRVTVLVGAVVITEASAAPGAATDVNGVRLEAGQSPILLPIETGYRFALIEAAALARQTARVPLLNNAAASGAAVSGVPAGSYLWAVQGTFGGATVTLRELGPDGANWLDLETLTAPGRKGVVVGEQATVRAFVTGGAPVGLYSELS